MRSTPRRISNEQGFTLAEVRPDPFSAANAPGVVWFSGRPGAGKSTTSRAVQDHLASLGVRVPLLDGDIIRRTVDPISSLARTPRPEVAALHARLAHMLARQGMMILVAAVSGIEHLREMSTDSMMPIVHVFIDVTPETAYDRRVARRSAVDSQLVTTSETYLGPRDPTIIRNEQFNPAQPADLSQLVTEIFQHLTTVDSQWKRPR